MGCRGRSMAIPDWVARSSSEMDADIPCGWMYSPSAVVAAAVQGLRVDEVEILYPVVAGSVDCANQQVPLCIG